MLFSIQIILYLNEEIFRFYYSFHENELQKSRIKEESFAYTKKEQSI